MLDWLEFSGEIVRRMGHLRDRHTDPEDRRYWNRVWGLLTWVVIISALVGAIAWKPALLLSVVYLSNYIPEALRTSGVEPNQSLVTALQVVVSAGGLILMVVVAAFGVVGVIAALIGVATYPKVKQYNKADVFPGKKPRRSGSR